MFFSLEFSVWTSDPTLLCGVLSSVTLLTSRKILKLSIAPLMCIIKV